MDNRINELDLAELRHECREIFKHAGFEGSLEVLTESIMFGQIMIEVLREEYQKLSDEHRQSD